VDKGIYEVGSILIHKSWGSLYIIREEDKDIKTYYLLPISEHFENKRWKRDRYPRGIPCKYEESVIYFQLGA
jgi:hypothetical protein